jgi:TrmH family RNA methyltransferase
MGKLETITSASNPVLKDVRKAISRGTLTSQGLCVAETFHLFEEALQSDCEVKAVLASQSAKSRAGRRLRRYAAPGLRFIVLPDRLFQELSTTESSPGIMTLVRPPAWTLEQLFQGESLVVILDGIQDPGNAGAIVRAAEAFGASGVMFLKGTVSPFNPKTLRASAGSLFHLPIVHGLDARQARVTLQRTRMDVFAALPFGGKALDEVDLSGKCAIVIGSEGHGLSKGWLSETQGIHIPTNRVESLNAAIAAGILLYEARRQRTLSR